LYSYVLNNPANLIDPLGLASNEFTIFTVLAKIEKVTSRFVVAGGALVTGSALAAGGAYVSGALIVAAPATGGLSFVALPVTGLVAGVGLGLVAFSADIYINEINAFLGTKITAPGDVLPDVFPRRCR